MASAQQHHRPQYPPEPPSLLAVFQLCAVASPRCESACPSAKGYSDHLHCHDILTALRRYRTG